MNDILCLPYGEFMSMYIHKHIHTRMHAQRPLQTDTDKDRQTDTQTDTDRQTHKHTHNCKNIHIDRQTDLEKATAPTEWVRPQPIATH